MRLVSIYTLDLCLSVQVCVQTGGSANVIESLQRRERRKLKRKVIAERGIHQGQKSRKQTGNW